MFGFGDMFNGLKANPKTIVFTEGTDARILEASARLLSGTFLKQAIKTAGPIVALGFMVCVALIIVSRRKESAC